MSCPNSEAPKCCPPPKKPCPPGPPTCSNLPATLTFTCPASEECAKKEEKPACPPQPCPETCVALGTAKPEPISSGGSSSGSSCAGASAESSSGSSSGSGACATVGSPNSCEVAPLSMDGKKC